VSEDSWFAPLEREGRGQAASSFRWESRRMGVVYQVTSIGSDPESKGRYFAEGRLTVYENYYSNNQTSKTTPFSLRAGETHRLGGYGPQARYTVRRIVPRDEQQKTIGWVELACEWDNHE